MAEDFGLQYTATLKIDSSAAKAMAIRKGLGKVRHISLKYLWIQARIALGDLKGEKEGTDDNLADIGTKHLDAGKLQSFVKRMGFKYQDGRSTGMP